LDRVCSENGDSRLHRQVGSSGPEDLNHVTTLTFLFGHNSIKTPLAAHNVVDSVH